MIDRKEKGTILWQIFLLVFGFAMILVWMLCVCKTENHLPMDKMIFLPMIVLGFFSVFYIVQRRQEQKYIVRLQMLSSAAAPVFILLYGVLLYFMAIYGRCEPVNDQKAVWQGALYLAGLSEEISWEYFARCNNNVMPVVILSLIFRAGSLGGRVDPYYFAVLLNVLQVMLAMYCVFQLGKKRNTLFGAWLGLLLFGMYFLPIASHTLSFYTDAMSFSLGIAGFYLWESGRKGWSRTGLTGLLFGLAAVVKITAMIPLIAMLGYTVITKEKKDLIRLSGALLFALSVFALCNYTTSLLPCEGLRDACGTPKVSYWVGIGLKGNGGYIDNQDYAAQLNTIYGMEEKAAWSAEYIRENIYEFWNKDHIVSKLRYNFANGDFGGGVFVQTASQDNLFYKLMHYNGEYFWRYSMIMTSIMYAVYLSIILGIWVQLIKRKKPDAVYAVSLISIFGIMFYVMLFEANCRQLYNHLPWLILAAECGLADFWIPSGKGEKKLCSTIYSYILKRRERRRESRSISD